MEKGQIVYLRPTVIGNAYRRNPNPIEAIVEKVGRKYVTIKIYGQFEIKTGSQKTTYCQDYVLYESKEKMAFVLEAESLSNKIRKSIPTYGTWDIDISKLRQIAEILELN